MRDGKEKLNRSTSTLTINKLKSKKVRYPLVLISVLLVLTITLLLLLHLSPVQQHILARVLDEVNSRLTYQLNVRNFSWIPSSSLSFNGVTLTDSNDVFARIDRLVLNYSFQLKWPEIIRITKVTLINPKCYLRKDSSGKWKLPELKTSEPAKTIEGKKRLEPAGETPWWEFLIPRKWIIEEGSLKIQPSEEKNDGEYYNFKNVNLVLSSSFKKINEKYQADFVLERGSFYQTMPGLGLVIANGHIILQKDALFVENVNLNIGKSFLGVVGKIWLAPTLKPELTFRLQNLAPSKVALFVPSWPLKKDLNVDATITGRGGIFLINGSTKWGKASVRYSGKIKLGKQNEPEIHFKLAFKGVDLEELSLPVSSSLSGKGQVNWTGSNLSSGTGNLNCELDKSFLADTRIETGEIVCTVNKAQLNVSTLNFSTDLGTIKASGFYNLASVSTENASGTKKLLQINGDISRLNLKPLLEEKDFPETNLNFNLQASLDSRNTHSTKNPPLWEQFDGNCLVEIRKSAIGEISVSSGKLDLFLNNGTITLRKVKILTQNSYLNSSGTIKIPERINIKYHTDMKDLSVISKLIKQGPIKGAIKSSGQIKGNLKKPDWVGELYAKNLKLMGYGAKELKISGESTFSFKTGKRVLDLHTTDFSFKDKKIDKASFHMKQDNRSLKASGFINFNREKTILKLDVESPDIFAAEKAFVIKSLELADNTVKWALQDEGIIKIGKTKLSIENLRLKNLNQEISLLGTIKWNDVCDLEFGLKSIDLERFGKLLGKPFPMSGFMNSKVTLKGSLATPVIQASGNIRKLKVEDVDLKPLTMNLSYNKPSLTWDCSFFNIRGMTEKIYGSLNLDINLKEKKITLPNDELKGVIKGKDIDLTILKEFEPDLREISGILDMDVNLSGKKDKPRISGTASLKNANLKMKGWSRTLKDVNLECKLHTRGINITRAKAYWGEGKITFRGWIPYPFGESKILNLVAKLDNVTLPNIYGIHSRVDADLHLDGDRFHPEFTGKVKIKKAIIMLDELMTDNESDIEFIDNGEKETEKSKKPIGFEHAFLDNLTMDLNILVEPGHALLNGKRINAELAGDLVVSKKPKQSVVVQGKLNTVRGAYNLQGKIFRIVEGTILFNGLSPPDPNLHVVCEYKVKDVHIYTTLKGSISKMQLELSSEPSMEKVDILAYILYGHPASELSSQQASNLGDEALALVGNRVAELLKEKILPDSPWVPDVITYKSGTSEEEGGVVMIGKYITPDLFIDVEKGTSSEVSDQMRIEYKINKHFSIESQIADEASSGVDIFWRYDFGE